MYTDYFVTITFCYLLLPLKLCSSKKIENIEFKEDKMHITDAQLIGLTITTITWFCSVNMWGDRPVTMIRPTTYTLFQRLCYLHRRGFNPTLPTEPEGRPTYYRHGPSHRWS